MALQFHEKEQIGTQNFETELLKRDYFEQKIVVRLPSSILTTTFVEAVVESAATREMLGDLRRPHSHLLVAQAYSGKLHVFDKTNMVWVFCAEFPVKKQQRDKSQL